MYMSERLSLTLLLYLYLCNTYSLPGSVPSALTVLNLLMLTTPKRLQLHIATGTYLYCF